MKGKGRRCCFERLLVTSDPFRAARLSKQTGGPGGAASQLPAGSVPAQLPREEPGLDRLGQGHLEPERVPPHEAGKEVCGVPSDHRVSEGPPSPLTCCTASSPAGDR